MKSLFLRSLAFVSLLSSTSAYANCDGVDKCIMRNPLGANECWLKIRVCPLSIDSVVEWVNGATPDTAKDALKDIDPIRGLQYYAKRLGVEGKVDVDVAGCFINTAATGVLGSACAAGVVELGVICFADLTCTAACVGTKTAVVGVLDDCIGG